MDWLNLSGHLSRISDTEVPWRSGRAAQPSRRKMPRTRAGGAAASAALTARLALVVQAAVLTLEIPFTSNYTYIRRGPVVGIVILAAITAVALYVAAWRPVTSSANVSSRIGVVSLSVLAIVAVALAYPLRLHVAGMPFVRYLVVLVVAVVPVVVGICVVLPARGRP